MNTFFFSQDSQKNSHLLNFNTPSLAQKLLLHKIQHTPHPEQIEREKKKTNLSNAHSIGISKTRDPTLLAVTVVVRMRVWRVRRRRVFLRRGLTGERGRAVRVFLMTESRTELRRRNSMTFRWCSRRRSGYWRCSHRSWSCSFRWRRCYHGRWNGGNQRRENCLGFQNWMSESVTNI